MIEDGSIHKFTSVRVVCMCVCVYSLGVVYMEGHVVVREESNCCL